MSTRDDKIALVQKLIDNAVASMGKDWEEWLEDHLFGDASSAGVGASFVGFEPVNMKLTPEQIHRLATAPLPQIRVVGSVSRWAGASSHLSPLEDGRIPQALRLDELDGDKS